MCYILTIFCILLFNNPNKNNPVKRPVCSAILKPDLNRSCLIKKGKKLIIKVINNSILKENTINSLIFS